MFISTYYFYLFIYLFLCYNYWFNLVILFQLLLFRIMLYYSCMAANSNLHWRQTEEVIDKRSREFAHDV